MLPSSFGITGLTADSTVHVAAFSLVTALGATGTVGLWYTQSAAGTADVSLSTDGTTLTFTVVTATQQPVGVLTPKWDTTTDHAGNRVGGATVTPSGHF